MFYILGSLLFTATGFLFYVIYNGYHIKSLLENCLIINDNMGYFFTDKCHEILAKYNKPTNINNYLRLFLNIENKKFIKQLESIKHRDIFDLMKKPYLIGTLETIANIVCRADFDKCISIFDYQNQIIIR